jgi:3'(2'), 5'-bisphosphate nucleotidase
MLLEGLRKITPGIPVVSEEGEQADRGALRSGEAHWLVDPLDGTKEFLKRTGEFTVNVALIRGGRPVAGVVHAPVLGRSWLGAADGAERREGNQRTPLRTRRASPDSLAVVASRDHAGPRVSALLRSLSGARTLSMGSSLKFCLIAEGQADFYLRDGPTMEWDTAAAQAVLEAAGGGVFTLDGKPLRYTKPELRNPHFVAVGDPEFDWQALIQRTAAEG